MNETSREISLWGTFVEVTIFGPLVYTFIGLIIYFAFQQKFSSSKIQAYEQWKSAMVPIILISPPSAIMQYLIFSQKIGYLYYPQDDAAKYYSIYHKIALSITYFLCMDALFYWSHRFMHHPYLYNLFHKYHHQYKQNLTVFSASAADASELIVLGFVALWIPPMIIPTCIEAYLFFVLFTTFWATYIHSMHPRRLGVFNDATDHLNHHTHPKYNFAFALEFWDKFAGTYKYDTNC